MARQYPTRPALFHGTQAVATYAQWAQRCAHLAQQFEAAGLKPGDRVALFMHNHPRYLEVMFGAWWAGLALVPINAKLHVREAQWIIDNGHGGSTIGRYGQWLGVVPGWQNLDEKGVARGRCFEAGTDPARPAGRG